MRFELEQTNRGASDDELLEDLRRCAAHFKSDTVTPTQYRQLGRFNEGRFAKRFGSWATALELAGLVRSRAATASDDELFENLRDLWIELGRQPRYRELRRPHSRYSFKAYLNRFGSWSSTLNAFVEWAAADSDSAQVDDTVADQTERETTPAARRRTSRGITERQRFRILVRDGLRCLACGASPLRTPGVELHVDHIVPWSDGGETVDDNLQVKCSRCNLGKGAAFRA